MWKKLEFKIVALLFVVVVLLSFCLCFSTCWQYYNQSLALNTVLNSNTEFDSEILHKSFYQATIQTLLASFALAVLIAVSAYFLIKKVIKDTEVAFTGIKEEADKSAGLVSALTSFITKKILKDCEPASAEVEKTIGESAELVRALTELNPIAYVLFDETMKPVDCNRMMLQLFDCPDKKFFFAQSYWDAFSPPCQPDGTPSLQKAKEVVAAMPPGGEVVFEWLHTTSTGEPVPVEATAKPLVHQGKNLLVSFKYDLRNIRKMEENIKFLEKESEKIYFDPLTGIFNRRYFDEHMADAIRTLPRSNSQLTLLMIDIDHFKQYNDTYGHSEGDNCLRMIAETLARSVHRPDDFVVRYGGEEFVVVLPNVDEKGAREVTERILTNIRNLQIPHQNNSAADHVTISIGVTTGSVAFTQSPNDYVKRADELLYNSKKEGRNRYTFGDLLLPE